MFMKKARSYFIFLYKFPFIEQFTYSHNAAPDTERGVAVILCATE